MKKRLFSVLMSVFILVFSTNVFASSSTAWLQEDSDGFEGKVETEVIATATNGKAELFKGDAPTGLNSSAVQFKFTADDGYSLDGQSDSITFNNPKIEGYYYNVEMQAVFDEQWGGSSAANETVLKNIDKYFDLEITTEDTDNSSFIILSVNVVRNAEPLPETSEGEYLFAYLEPELSVTVDVDFLPIEYSYNVTAISEPLGVATFTGELSDVVDGTEYNVAVDEITAGYEFVEWLVEPTGTIEGSDVEVIASFKATESDTYSVTAKAQPLGAATFTGELSGVVDGTEYNVAVDEITAGYEFVEWLVEPTGTIEGSDVEVIALFKEKTTETIDYTYNVTAKAQPSGAATFTGELSGVDNGTAYNVAVDVISEGFEFVEWIVDPIGTIEGSDVEVIASFTRVESETYYVRATSSPSGVASFTGVGESFEYGQEYDVNYKLLNSGYKFIGWSSADQGTISGNVDLVANFEKKGSPPVYKYSVTAESNPAGVTTFTGTGTDFIYNTSYEVSFVTVAEGYVFTGWTGVPSGTITSNVHVIANFEPIAPKTYNVTVLAQPSEAATFTGELSNVIDGSDFDVAVDAITEGFEFVEWIGEPKGTIKGADVEVIASFKEVVLEEVFLDEVIAEELLTEDLTTEALPEAGGIPAIAFGGLGLALATIGKKLRK